VRHRAVRPRFQHSQPEALEGFVQVSSEDAVVIVNQVAIAILESNRRTQLLQCPSRSRVYRNIEVEQPTRSMMDKHQDVEQSEGRGHRHEEVTSDDRLA